MAHNELFVRMASHILVIEFAVKLRVDFHTCLILLRPHVLEFGTGSSLVLFAFLRQTAVL